MRIPLPAIACLVLLCMSTVTAEVFYWTDPDGTANFSDTAPPDKAVKKLKGYDQCPLRAEIVELDLSDRANLGVWLYLGAPRITQESRGRRRVDYDRWPKTVWEYERDIRSARMMRIKNEIISEARRCGVGNEQACACSRSLFHDPPRGFAPEGYVPPSIEQVNALSTLLAQRGLEE